MCRAHVAVPVIKDRSCNLEALLLGPVQFHGPNRGVEEVHRNLLEEYVSEFVYVCRYSVEQGALIRDFNL